MPKKKPQNSKIARLKQRGCLNRTPEAVSETIFVDNDFFDQNDAIQVKYEMVRAIQVDNRPVSHAARAFGYSRPATYGVMKAFNEGGIQALLPKKTGPRRAHKLDENVVEFMQDAVEEDPTLRAPALADLVAKKRNLSVHPRSIERALKRSKKKEQ